MVWPSARSVAHEIGEQREGIAERLELGDLAADMHVDAGDLDARQLGGAGIDLARAADRDAELVLGLAGGDLVVGLGVDVGIDAQRDMRRVRPFAAAIADSSSSSGSDSTLKQRMPASSASAISRAVLPTPENMILSGGMPAARARCSSPSETTSAPAPSSRQRRDHRLVGIGLHGVADERVGTSAKAPAKTW